MKEMLFGLISLKNLLSENIYKALLYTPPPYLQTFIFTHMSLVFQNCKRKLFKGDLLPMRLTSMSHSHPRWPSWPVDGTLGAQGCRGHPHDDITSSRLASSLREQLHAGTLHPWSTGSFRERAAGTGCVWESWSTSSASKCLPYQKASTNKGPSSQGYGFSSGHVWMWELD